MMRQITDYFERLIGGIGSGWNRFWFTPQNPATLSAIRLLTGLVVVYLHATLSRDLITFFGPGGLLPAAEIAPLEAGSFSYMNYLSTSDELWAAHLLGLAVLVLFAAGLWTRLTSVLGLIVFLSVVHRAPMITSRAESLLAMVMCYLCLAPCGQRFSLDRWLARRSAKEPLAGGGIDRKSTLATIATRLLQIHFTLLIAMMAFSKLSGETWWTGSGMWWLVARHESRLVDFTWLHTTPKAIAAWTHAIVLFELAFPVLIWVPLARPLLLALGIVIWTSLALVTGEIPFALMLIIASLAFVSPEFIETVFGGTRRDPADATT